MIYGRYIEKTAIAALSDENSRVRKNAVFCLRNIDWHPPTPELNIKFLVACQAWYYLASYGDIAIGPLVSLLNDEDNAVREGAAQALAQLGDARAVDPLIALLSDERDTVRAAAAKALGQLGDARAGHCQVNDSRIERRYPCSIIKVIRW